MHEKGKVTLSAQCMRLPRGYAARNCGGGAGGCRGGYAAGERARKEGDEKEHARKDLRGGR